MPHDIWQTFTWVVLVVVCAWFVYLLVKLAELAGAWPFS